jgi:hypothetical protein
MKTRRPVNSDVIPRRFLKTANGHVWHVVQVAAIARDDDGWAAKMQ